MNKISLTKEQIYFGSLILVNHEYPLVEMGLDPLVTNLEKSDIKLQRQASVLLSNLMREINGWKEIVPVSGWRSLGEQQKIWNDTVKERGWEYARKYVAVPGHSEHQTGLAIDLGLNQNNIDFICPEFPYFGICQQFRERAASYGFIERYPAGKESITGIGHEPWHFRYVGVPHAQIIINEGLTLEEYISFIKQFYYGNKTYSIHGGGQNISISYISAIQAADTEIKVGHNKPYSISGNNTDGFILTEWR
ncbi:M15 family metallopeptidase [Anaerosacchariphilus polymeriproducens]|uniref:D-alanyl-D-alanine carboxypeptidase family protein n=1 Tax=Anaerosacchariphilus polymeriproducens TaxID=1812858 RepID=A0A371AZD8_9FIRM|nr:M15 family metallopeptidase [Anaerosacchariphilus polymeriproducens]RDU24913.1 D-alanyl-D-alanine carboxypeptidase family protein [Anaerosacchariphilus polymeriproducens]